MVVELVTGGLNDGYYLTGNLSDKAQSKSPVYKRH